MRSQTTSHNEYGQITSIMLKKAKDAFISEERISSEWKSLNFTEAPVLDTCIDQYNDFEKIIIDQIQPVIHYLPQDDSLTLDSLYCRDAAIVTDHGVILCNMGKANRKGEPSAIKSLCEKKGIKILGAIEEPGTIEGGDIAWIDYHTLAVANAYRTNQSGIDQLRSFLKPFDIEIMEVHLPHYKGAGDVFHLMSIFSPIDRDIAVVYSSLMPVTFRNALLDRHYRLIEVPDTEFESMGCNVLAISPRNVMMVSGNPITAERIRHAGCTVHEYDGSEISIKGGGGPTCLTRPLMRTLFDTGFA